MPCFFYISKPQDATVWSLFYTLFSKVVQYFCTTSNSKKSRFIKKHEASRLWSQLGIKTTYGKYAWVVLLKDKKGITIANAFQKVLSQNESKHKPNKIWVDAGIEFYNRLMKSWLQENDIEMYLTHDEGL